MKKIIFSLFVITSLVACESKTENTANTIPTNAVGYDLDSSENINTAKKALDAGVNSDSAAFIAIYADTTVIYDNMNKQTIYDNMKMSAFFKSKGITMKLEKINAIWESVNFKADEIGVFNFVSLYADVSFTKETKKVIVRMNGVFAFKNGKIVREWDTYDSAPIMDLMK